METIKERIKPFLDGKSSTTILEIVIEIIKENEAENKQKLMEEVENSSSMEEVVCILKHW